MAIIFSLLPPTHRLSKQCFDFFSLYFRLYFWLYLSSTKVTVQRLAGSPSGYGHDILIKSTSTADYITQESKINHSRGEQDYPSSNGKETPSQANRDEMPYLWLFIFSCFSLFSFNFSLLWGEIRALVNWKASTVGRALCIDFFSLSQTSGIKREGDIFYNCTHGRFMV